MSDATNYLVMWHSTSDPSNRSNGGWLESTARSQTIDGLTSNQTHWFYVLGIYSDGTDPEYDWATVSPTPN